MHRSEIQPRPVVKPADPVMYTLRQFCEAHHISKSKLYLLFDAGEGPVAVRVGRRLLITGEAAQAWRRKLEERAGKEIQP